MIKIKYLLAVFACMFIFPSLSSADCDYERKAELSRIASNVRFSYTYDIENEIPVFNVLITNLTNDIYVVDSDGAVFTVSEVSKKYPYAAFADYDIYSNSDNCKDEKLLHQRISFPYYNYLTTLPVCKEYPNFKYCSLWGDYGESVESNFYTELEKYKKQLAASKINYSEEVSYYEKIKQWMADNSFALICSFFSIILLIVVFVLRRVRSYE